MGQLNPMILPFQAVHFETATVRYDDASSASTAEQKIKVPAGCIVLGVDLIVHTAFDASGAALKVGDGTNDVGFFADAQAQLATAGRKSLLSKMFISTEQTGNGSAQSIAHGLGVTPTSVLIAPTDTAPATAGDYTAAEGTHTATNVLATVTNGKKYKVMALAQAALNGKYYATEDTIDVKFTPGTSGTAGEATIVAYFIPLQLAAVAGLVG